MVERDTRSTQELLSIPNPTEQDTAEILRRADAEKEYFRKVAELGKIERKLVDHIVKYPECKSDPKIVTFIANHPEYRIRIGPRLTMNLHYKVDDNPHFYITKHGYDWLDTIENDDDDDNDDDNDDRFEQGEFFLMDHEYVIMKICDGEYSHDRNTSGTSRSEIVNIIAERAAPENEDRQCLIEESIDGMLHVDDLLNYMIDEYLLTLTKPIDSEKCICSECHH
jgi:hypothetical protein